MLIIVSCFGSRAFSCLESASNYGLILSMSFVDWVMLDAFGNPVD